MSTPLNWTRADWLNLLLFALLVLLFHWRIITPNLADRQSYPPGDFSHQFWSFSTFEVRELSAGRLPLWNPYTYGGAPFWADVQSAVFYPPSLLTILLSAPWGFSLFALELEAIAHFWLAATFMYLFIRQITHNRHAALIAALTFTFSGYLTGYPSQQLAVLEVDVWLPLILYFIAQFEYKTNLVAGKDIYPQSLQLGGKLGRSRKMNLPEPAEGKLASTSSANGFWEVLKLGTALRSSLLAGVALGLALLAGHPQSGFIIVCLSTTYWAFTIYHLPLNSHRLTIFLHHYLLFTITGLGLAAIQFLPAIEYTLHSVRASGVYDNMAGGFPMIDLIQLALPGLVSHYSPLYISIVGLILAVGAIFTHHAYQRQTTFWAVLAGISLLMSFGGHTFLYSPLYLGLPGFSMFRGQERWAFATAFSLSVLVGYGFMLVMGKTSPQFPSSLSLCGITGRKSSGRERAVSRLTQYAFGFSLLLTLLAFYGLNDSGWRADNPFYDLLGASTMLSLLVGLSWLLWRGQPHLSPTMFTVLTATLLCFDLFTANWQTNLYPQLPEWHTQMPTVVQAIEADARNSVSLKNQVPDHYYDRLTEHVQSFRVYNEFRVYDNYGVPFAIPDLWGASPLRPARYAEFLAPPMPIERTWELLNVKYVISWRKELFLPSTIIYEESATDGMTYVHRLKKVGPRAWLVNQIQVTDDETIRQRIAAPEFDRWQIGLLESDESDEITLKSSQSETIISEITTLTHHAPGHLSLTVNSSEPALLILSEPYYPGWQATVNGQATSILRADYILRAIPVPAGESAVELQFWPLSFIIGALISGLTVILLVGFCACVI
ncbi:YfhO family protein [Anaerolineales bacterium HSG24]|nr:YfhO family protein [Anaerolineales bacterium HSG24]